MSGQEDWFLDHVDLAIDRTPADRPFEYLELGLGDGKTFKTVMTYLRIRHRPFRMDGVDLPNYPFDLFLQGPDWVARWHKTGNEAFLAGTEGRPDFVFLDACHGAPCVTRDFLGVEPIIRPGGILAFHDISRLAQGRQKQVHCGTGIEVRRAVQDLGLLDSTRPGWHKLMETPATQGSFGCLYVEKVK